MSVALAEIGAGFAQPVHGAQRVFRALLQAMARPGTVQRLDAAALAGLEPPALQPATAAVLLSLLDADTRLRLEGRLQQEPAWQYLAFHTGMRRAPLAEADFVAVAAGDARASLWTQLPDGTDLAPQAGATLVVEAAWPHDDAHAPQACRLALRGPGVRGMQRLSVQGLSPDFWRARIERQADFPRGIDLVLVCGDTVAAVPRTTQITLED